MKLTTLLVCDAGLDKRQTIEDLIHSQPSLALVGTVSGGMAREQIGSLHPKLVWIELSPAPVRGLSLLAELRETFPQLYFFVSYEVPDPELDLDYVPGEARPLILGNGHPPTAISNSFAFGGHNVTLAIRGAES